MSEKEKKEEFRIIECKDGEITVNRRPENEMEISMMRSAAQDMLVRKMLESGSGIVFPE